MTSVLRMVAARVQASGWGVDDRWPKRQHVKSPFRMGVTREYKRDPQGFGPTLQSRSTRPLHLQWTLHISPGTHVLAVVHHENSNGRNCTPIRWRLEREGFQTTPMPYSWMCDSRPRFARMLTCDGWRSTVGKVESTKYGLRNHGSSRSCNWASRGIEASTRQSFLRR